MPRDARDPSGGLIAQISRPCAACPHVAAVNDYSTIPPGWLVIMTSQGAAIYVCSAECLRIYATRQASTTSIWNR